MSVSRFIPFHNISFYQLTTALELSAEQLEEKIKPDAFRENEVVLVRQEGWTAPCSLADCLAFPLPDSPEWMLLSFRTDTRTVPAAEIKRVLPAMQERYEQAKGGRLSRAEKNVMRDDAFASLLPRSFPKTSSTRALINTKRSLILIDSQNPARCEALLAKLRMGLGSLPVVPYMPALTMCETFAAWMREPLYDVNITGNATFKSSVAGGMEARIKNLTDIRSGAVRELLHDEDGKVTEIGLKIDGAEFTLTDDFQVKN